MLTDTEKSHIEKILKCLSYDDLQSLASTVSKGQVDCTCYEECIKVVLSFEKSGEDFLRRRIISRKILTDYAYKRNLPVADCRHMEDIIRIILNFWSNSGTGIVQKLQVQDQSVVRDACHTNTNIFNTYTFNIQVNPNTSLPDQDHLYGKQFCHWFFTMLNHPNPEQQGFGPSHFMPNAQLFFKLLSWRGVSENSFTNSSDVSKFLLTLFKKFLFNPNISDEGLRVKSDLHGLKLVLICGTLFKGSSLCGSFEQSFGLVKDPHLADNWKIHVIALKCSEVQGHVTPKIEDSSLETMAVMSLQTLKR